MPAEVPGIYEFTSKTWMAGQARPWRRCDPV